MKSLLLSSILVAVKPTPRLLGEGFKFTSFNLPFPLNLWYAFLGVFTYGPLEVFFVIWLIVNMDRILGTLERKISAGLVVTVLVFELSHVIFATGGILNAITVTITFFILGLIFKYTGNSIGSMIAWTPTNGFIPSSRLSNLAKSLVNDMRRAIKLYRSLGAHSKKLFYVEDMQVLAFIYGSILKKIKRKGIRFDREFWKEPAQPIYSRTLIEEFNKIAEVEIGIDIIENILKIAPPKYEVQRIVADHYFYLKSILSVNLHDPIHREIMRRLEELRRQRILRKSLNIGCLCGGPAGI